jgi:FixJ family two-component response regulator
MKSTPTVFVVDDEEPIRHAFEAFLNTQGIAVLSFSSAEDFLHSYREDWTGCLFADVQMPDMSGIELIRQLRARNSILPVVLMTGRESTHSLQEVFDEKISVLEKPFSAEVVANMVRDNVPMAAREEV